MRLLIICNSSSGLLRFRGCLINRLMQAEHTVTAIVPELSMPEEFNAEHELKAMGCDLIHVSMERRGTNPIQDVKLLYALKRVEKRGFYDFVITYTIKPNIYGGMVSRILHVAYAANITGLGTAFQNDGLIRKLVVWLYKVALKNAKVVFFENEENLLMFVDAGIVPNGRAYLLDGAGVDLLMFSYQKYPEDGNKIRFLFIGRIMREKGINELFEAMKRLRNEGILCSLTVLGEYEENYKQLIDNYESEGWLKYRGYQSDVRHYIAECHCFVLPSWHEGMANTNLECAAMGRPLITSNVHGCLEAVIDGESGFLCAPRNVVSLYDAMKKFSSLRYTEREAMGKAGRRYMESRFSKVRVVDKTLAVLGL